MTDVTLRVHEDGADDERIEQLTTFLRAELRELVPVSSVAGEAAEGAKALDPAEIGAVLTTISQSTVLAALINAVSSWLGQRRERSVTVEADGDTLELTGAPSDAERALAAQWLERRRLKRYALIIASYEFTDPGLSALRAPAHDAARLGEVLADPRIGGFDVRTLINSSAAEVNEAVEDFFADREPDDLLVLHFSGHGVKDEAGELHFATSGTRLNRLAGTAVSADFVARRMTRSRSRRIVLLLDCCYSGAFGRGMVARAGGSVGIEEQFGGSGRAVITASSSMEYAFEGASVADTSVGEPSVFTSALVEGLESGDADRDQDGHVGLDELYEYVYDRVRRVTPHQTPGKWMLDVRGDLRIARRARPVSVPAPLSSDLQEAIDHSLPGVRAGAIPSLVRMLSVAHEGRVLAARLALRRLAEDDSRMVATAAAKALADDESRKTAVLDEEAGRRGAAVVASGEGSGRRGAVGALREEAGRPGPAAADRAAERRAGGHPATEGRTTSGTSRGRAPTSLIAGREGADSATGAGQAHAGVPLDREPPLSTVLSRSDSPAGFDRPAGSDNPVASDGPAGTAVSGEQAAQPDERGSGPRRSFLTASGAGSAASGAIPSRVPDFEAATSGPIAATPEGGSAIGPVSIAAALPRLAAGLALVLLVIGLMTVTGGLTNHLGDTIPNTLLFATVWPWALVATMFALTCRDHPWLPGAALGLLAGTTGLVGGSGATYLPFQLGMAATVAATALLASPWWLAAVSGVLGAVGVLAVAASADALESFTGDATDLTFLAVALALTGLAAYRMWRARAWFTAIAPALLVLDAALHLTGVPLFVLHASFAGLVVVPLIATLTSGRARFAGYVTVAAGLLVRANEYVAASEPTFTSVSHVALPLAAAIAAYFSRSR
ncbi:caspase family protein [Lentzea nigeriaca]|uniref:caspase family protein n=1 Tax=Lentzea nigeriaca TaxID=1128665 RepID=UPI001956D4AA|nr:caspase family protein [Lentzea nigeriaca]MBM7856621.1 hypothetical protein [Lentzea nigeriaca]